MGSMIAWLDTTAEEQRIARELIALFTQIESRDELGIGQVRDAFSESLFPGTSVIQTRARYFLFVPWCYRDGKAHGRSGERCRVLGERQERHLIATFLKARENGESDDLSGLIGIRAGIAVKTLPSAIYWGALYRYGVLTHDTDRNHLGLREAIDPDPATELASREIGDWQAGLPPAPDDFPAQVPGGFDMTYDEAAWLAHRLLMATQGTALSHLLERREQISSGAEFPWESIPESQFGELHHARLFSTVMHGAALLYNLLVAERYEQDPQLTRLDSPVDFYRDWLQEWADESIAPIFGEVRSWDVDGMWRVIAAGNPRVHPATQMFVNAWISAVKQGQSASVGVDRGLRYLVHHREARKGNQSRLVNDRMLATWSGASGAGQLAYRWGTVRVLVNDIVRGLQADVAS
jgi:hypothetical protein